MKKKGKSVYKGRLVELKRETEKAGLLRIKWGNGITEGWIPKKAYWVDGEWARVRAWFIETLAKEQRA